ncbi:MAG: histidinol-phosphate transaminase [Rhodocyclaceae bacterium]|nr:histidinol-phosphate transaminase [Rhodocyclaceae bacterium]
MSRFWSPIVHGLTPYTPGEQPKIANLIKLNTNECPYPPSPRVLAAIGSAVNGDLRLYPDPDSTALRQAIAEYYAVGRDHVFVGNGSDEILAFAFQALLNHDGPLVYPDITYSFYPVYCQLNDITAETVPLNDDFSLDLDAIPHHAGAVIFPNPNAPTGQVVSLEAIRRLCQRLPDQVIVVDEAYVDFGTETAIPLVKDHPNLLVVQTFSKSRALAGLRVGFAIGQPELLAGLERVKNSFNSYPVDRLASVGAIAAIEDRQGFDYDRQRIIESRTWLAEQLTVMGFEVVPSKANFVFVRHPNRDAGELAVALRERAIIVRHFRLPRIDQHLRITIGTREECTALVTALQAIMA